MPHTPRRILCIFGVAATGHCVAAGLAEAQALQSALTVCAIDRTGSAKAFLHGGIDVCAREIVAATGGSTVIVRWISDASLRTSEEVVRITIPITPRCSNPYDLRCRRAAQESETAIRAAKRVALSRLLAAVPAVAMRTDFVGFVQAAADAFADDQKGLKHRLIVASDLQDNRAFKAAPSLDGVIVIIVPLIEIEDPAVLIELRKKWSEWFTQLGVEQIRFRQIGGVR